MLDIKFIRENPQVIKKDLQKRGDKEKLAWLDDILKKDEEYRKLLQENEKLKQDNLSLYRTIERLKNDPEYIESIARKELGMIKKDEVILKPKNRVDKGKKTSQ